MAAYINFAAIANFRAFHLRPQAVPEKFRNKGVCVEFIDENGGGLHPKSPLVGADLDYTRTVTHGREVDL